MSLSVDIRKRLGDFTLNVRFDAEDPSETLGLLGASGCGKSMALKCIAGIERPDEGRIVLNGRVLYDSAARVNLPPQQRRVGYLFQNYALFPTMTVEANVATGVREGTRSERAAKAREQLRAFRLGGLENRRPAELSGGQQQRVALARIMANEPELLLLDEPFSALDGYLRWQLELELADTLRAFPGGVVFVTHSRDEVYRMCDRVCVLTDGTSGRCMPTRNLFDAPTTLSEALISGCKNVSAAEPVGERLLACAGWGVTLACARPVAGCSHAGVRAHFLRIVEADGRPVDSIGDAPTGFASSAGEDARAASSRPSERLAAPFRQPARRAEVMEPKEAPINHLASKPHVSASANRIPCTVARVIDNVFSTIVMCDTPGGSQLRVELAKDAWLRLGNPSRVMLEVDPADVMPLEA